MRTRHQMELDHLAARVKRGDALWPPQLALATCIGLNLLLSEKISVGPGWLMPAIEGALLVVLVIVAPDRAHRRNHRQRRFALAVIGLVTLANVVSLALLVHYLVVGGRAGGLHLIESGALLWLTNVLLFSVWFWEMDRGGPVARHLDAHALPDFLFPQMDTDQKNFPRGWRPGYLDYLYTSLTNATAFSPTDTMPMTQSAKLVMALQSVSALLTIGLVIARAVNILN